MKIFFVILGIICVFLLAAIIVGENIWYSVSNPFRKVKKKQGWHIVRDIDNMIQLDEYEQRIS